MASHQQKSSDESDPVTDGWMHHYRIHSTSTDTTNLCPPPPSVRFEAKSFQKKVTIKNTFYQATSLRRLTLLLTCRVSVLIRWYMTPPGRLRMLGSKASQEVLRSKLKRRVACNEICSLSVSAVFNARQSLFNSTSTQLDKMFILFSLFMFIKQSQE